MRNNLFWYGGSTYFISNRNEQYDVNMGGACAGKKLVMVMVTQLYK